MLRIECGGDLNVDAVKFLVRIIIEVYPEDMGGEQRNRGQDTLAGEDGPVQLRLIYGEGNEWVQTSYSLPPCRRSRSFLGSTRNSRIRESNHLHLSLPTTAPILRKTLERLDKFLSASAPDVQGYPDQIV